jgi:hypothetical protein
MIDLYITTDEYGEVPYTAVNSDATGPMGRELYQRAIAGDFGPIAPYTAPPPIVPQEITRRQCAKQLRIIGFITPGESVVMIKTATEPTAVAALIAALPAEQQDNAHEDFGADTYRRDNPLLNGLMQAAGKTPEDIDQFFIDAAQL